MSNENNQLGLSNFISLEWFFNKPEEKEEDAGAIHRWIYANVHDGKLKPGVRFKESSIDMRGKNAAVFHRSAKPISDVFNEFRKDLDDYKAIYNSNKGAVQAFARAQKSIIKDLDKIDGQHAAYSEVKNVLLKHKAYSIKYNKENSIARKFHEPAHHFLGDYTTAFLNEGRNSFLTSQKEGTHEVVHVSSLQESEQSQVVKLACELLGFSGELEDFSEEVGVCIDWTDPPIRGFMDHINADGEAMAILQPFSEHGMTDEDSNAGLVDVLQKRVDNLSDALWSYIRHSCHS